MAQVKFPSSLLGSRAPEFKLQNERGEWVTLSSFLKQGGLMLVFYPGDFTPVCTRQLCAYQDLYAEFGRFGVQIVGISANSPEEHVQFRERYQFAFPLLSDPGKEVFRLYGITSLFLLGGTSRAVLLISQDGTIRYRYVEPTAITYRKGDELLKMIEELRQKGQI